MDSESTAKQYKLLVQDTEDAMFIVNFHECSFAEFVCQLVRFVDTLVNIVTENH